MVKFIKGFLFVILLLILLLITCWFTLPYWISPVAQYFLPEGSQLILSERPKLIYRGVRLNNIKFNLSDCALTQLNDISVVYQNRRFVLNADNLNIDTHCLEHLPKSKSQESTFLLIALQQNLPLFDVSVHRLSIMSWEQYAGTLTINNDGNQQQLNYQSDYVSGSISFNQHQELVINSLHFIITETNESLDLNGQVIIPTNLDSIPLNGQFSASFSSHYFTQPILVDLNWSNWKGTLIAKVKGDHSTQEESETELVNLPWILTNEQFSIEQGKWSWPYSSMPLSGGLGLTLSEWQDNYTKALLQARVNLLTNGHGGKATLVLSVGPDTISLAENNVRFQLTGKAGMQDIAAYIAVPGLVTNSLVDPVIRLQPGSLVRATGHFSPELTLQEARFPLAGISITQKGISGRLQSIVNATHKQWGEFKLHLDGKAEQFLPDQGLWQWKFWGNGNVKPISAKWDVGGQGQWQNDVINIDTMTTGFNQISYDQVHVQSPRVELTQPIIWQRSKATPSFNGVLQLHANKVDFSNGGYLPRTQLDLALIGSDPNNFNWKGELTAKPVGPIRLNGRWDGERLRGEAWWPQQSLRVFQSLISPDAEIKIGNGILYAQAAFSAASEQGFEAGGHFVVKDGSAWLKDGEVTGVNFTASYRLKDHVWQLGSKGPIKLTIKQLDNLFEVSNITANLQGYYPYNNRQPLVLSNVGVDMLGGHVGMSDFRLPQQKPTTLKVKDIELSELFTVLKPKQLAMSGKVSGELPLYAENPQWLIKDGWVENSGALTLRLDQQLVDSIIKDNIAAGVAMDWLRYVEISHLRADINVSNLGILNMAVRLEGVNSAKNKQKPIVLNYTQEENIFQLWRSLRFGDNLQDWLEQQLDDLVEKNHIN